MRKTPRTTINAEPTRKALDRAEGSTADWPGARKAVEYAHDPYLGLDRSVSLKSYAYHTAAEALELDAK